MDTFFVYHQKLETGPLRRDLLEAMILAGVYPPDVRVRPAEDPEGAWAPFSKARGANVAPPPLPGSKGPGVERKKGSTVAAAAIAFGIFFLICAVVGVFMFVRHVAVTTKTTSPTVALSRSTDSSSRSIFASPQPGSAPDVSRAVAFDTKPPAASSSSGFFPLTSSSSSSTKPPSTALGNAARELREDSQIYRDATGRTYRVPHAAYLRLVGMKAALDAKLKEIQEGNQELDSIQAQLDSSRASLNRNSQAAVDAFNTDVNRFNAMGIAAQSRSDLYNREVDAFNSELERVGTPTR